MTGFLYTSLDRIRGAHCLRDDGRIRSHSRERATFRTEEGIDGDGMYVRDTIKVYDTNVRRDAAARINKFKRDLEKKIDKIREDLTKGVYNKDTDEKIVKMRADITRADITRADITSAGDRRQTR